MKAHALKISVAINLVLIGMVIGLSGVIVARPSSMIGPPPPPVMMVDKFLRDMVVKGLPREKRDRALAAVDRRSASMYDEIENLDLDVTPVSPSEGPMAKAFIAGTMDEAFVAQWVHDREAGQEARTRFIASVFMDLSAILDRAEREAFLHTLDRELGGPPPGPGGPPRSPE